MPAILNFNADIVTTLLVIGGKEKLGGPRRKWVDNIKTDLAEIVWGGMDWIGLVQDRDKWKALVKAVMNLWVP
jgi:hypothetical protein